VVNVQNPAPDVLATDFFRPVDTRAVATVDKLVKNGVEAQTGDERSDFTRFLFSFEYRRPPLIHELCRRGPEIMGQDMDSDQSFRAVLQEERFDENASFCANQLGLLSEDRPSQSCSNWSTTAVTARSSSIGIGALPARAPDKEPFCCRIGP